MIALCLEILESVVSLEGAETEYVQLFRLPACQYRAHDARLWFRDPQLQEARRV